MRQERHALAGPPCPPMPAAERHLSAAASPKRGPFSVKGPQGVYCTAAHSAWARHPPKGGAWRPLEDRLSGGADELPAPRFPARGYELSDLVS